MFVKTFVMSFMGAARAQRPQAVALRLAEVPARVHFLVTPSGDATRAALAAGRSDRGFTQRIRASVAGQFRRAAKSAARAALRAAYVGSPLTPTGYVVLALTVGAIAMVAMLVTSSAGSEMEGALSVNGYFS